MKLPREVPVMTLSNATLFPQALLPLYVYEPRYRQMLADALKTHRMFSVAMQKPGRVREAPSSIAGLGLIRVAVGHKDGTSHLILQGIARVELVQPMRYKPYRVHQIRLLESPPCNTIAVDALLAKIRELLEQRVKMGMPFPFPIMAQQSPEIIDDTPPPTLSGRDILNYLEKVDDPEQAADLISCAVLPDASERQTILETINLEARLRHLVHFLLGEIKRRKKP